MTTATKISLQSIGVNTLEGTAFVYVRDCRIEVDFQESQSLGTEYLRVDNTKGLASLLNCSESEAHTLVEMLSD